jgi:hypothetical protein
MKMLNRDCAWHASPNTLTRHLYIVYPKAKENIPAPFLCLLRIQTSRGLPAWCAVQVPVLLAVDRYNALYAPSNYGKTVNDHKRRMLDPSELRLARAMRIMEHTSPAKGMSLAAMARHDRIPERIPVRPPASYAWHWPPVVHACVPLPSHMRMQPSTLLSIEEAGLVTACVHGI